MPSPVVPWSRSSAISSGSSGNSDDQPSPTVNVSRGSKSDVAYSPSAIALLPSAYGSVGAGVGARDGSGEGARVGVAAGAADAAWDEATELVGAADGPEPQAARVAPTSRARSKGARPWAMGQVLLSGGGVASPTRADPRVRPKI